MISIAQSAGVSAGEMLSFFTRTGEKAIGRIVRQTGPDSLEAVVTDAPPPVGIGFGSDGALYFDYPAFSPNVGQGIGVLARADLAMAPVSFAGVAAPMTCM